MLIWAEASLTNEILSLGHVAPKILDSTHMNGKKLTNGEVLYLQEGCYS